MTSAPFAEWGRVARARSAAAELRRMTLYIKPAEFPGLAKKIRSALKSAQGAIRNAHRFEPK